MYNTEWAAFAAQTILQRSFSQQQKKKTKITILQRIAQKNNYSIIFMKQRNTNHYYLSHCDGDIVSHFTRSIG